MLQRIFVFGLCALVLPASWAEDKNLEKIVVNADPLNRGLNELMSPVQVLSDDELQARNSASIGETLSQSAGIHNAGYGSAVGRPVMRGLGGARVKVMQNGVDSMDVATISPDHGVAVDSQHATQVEILRGPSALIFGSEAMAGAVNVVDQRIPLNVQYNQTRVASELSSVDEGQLLSLNSQYSLGQYGAQFSASQRKQEDYDLASGDEKTLHNSDVLMQNLNAGFAWISGNLQAGFAISTMHNEFGLPGHEHHDDHDPDHAGHEDEEEEGAARVDMDQTRLDVNANWAMNSGPWQSLNWKMGLVDYKHSEGHVEEHDEDEAVEEAAGEHEEHAGLSTFKRKAVESRLSVNYQADQKNKGVLGLQLNNSDFSADGGEAIVPNTHSTGLALFALHSFAIRDDLNTELAARLERNRHDVDTSQLTSTHEEECEIDISEVKDRQFNHYSLSGGLQFKASDQVSVRSNISRVSRAPAAQELYSCGPHESTETFEVGDSQLDDESAITMDVGLAWQGENWLVDASIYRNNFSNFIYQQNQNREEDGLAVYKYVQQDAHLQGYEINVTRSWENGVQVQVFADAVVAKFDAGAQKDQYLPRMPANRQGLDISFHHYLWGAYARLTHYQTQDKLAGQETATPGFDQLNMGLNHLTAMRDGELKLYAVLQNVLDEEMAYHTSFVKDEVSQPGRNIKLGVSYLF